MNALFNETLSKFSLWGQEESHEQTNNQMLTQHSKTWTITVSNNNNWIDT